MRSVSASQRRDFTGSWKTPAPPRIYSFPNSSAGLPDILEGIKKVYAAAGRFSNNAFLSAGQICRSFRLHRSR